MTEPTNPIIVTGTALATSDTIDELLDLAMHHVRRSRTERGCLSHAVYRDVEDPLRLFFFERWASRADLDAHFAVPDSNAFVQALNTLTAEPASIHLDVVANKK